MTKGRVQFDQPIGSYQAIHHLCADMLVELEASRAPAYEAAETAWKLSERLPYALEISMPKQGAVIAQTGNSRELSYSR